MLKLIRLAEVSGMAGIKTTEIYARMKEGTFPKPARVGKLRGVRWEVNEVQQWIKAQLDARS